MKINREKKIAKLKQGSGVFKYVGGAYDSEFVPGVQALDGDGNPLFDKRKKEPVWVKAPKMIKRELDVYPLVQRVLSEEEMSRGAVARPPRQRFPLGVEVAVNDPRLALKLRCLGFMEEIEEPEKPKRGRPAKAEVDPEE